MEQNWPEAMGVYRVFAPATGESFVGFSRNLRSTKKRLRFELTLNACSYKALQAFYNENGGAVEFEVLELFDPSPMRSEEELDAHMHAMLYRHKVPLKAKIIQQPI